MANKTVTIKDIIDMSIEELRSVSIPADYLETMGAPISRALSNLKFVAKAIRDNEAAADEPTEGGNTDGEEKDQLEGTVQE